MILTHSLGFKYSTNDPIYQRGRRIVLKSFAKMFEYSFSNYSFYSQSINDYFKRKKPSLRRRFIYHTITINIFMQLILYLFLINYPERQGIKYLGAPLTLLTNGNNDWLIYVLCSFVLFYILYLRIYYSNRENNFNFHPFDYYQDMKTFEPGDRLTLRESYYKFSNVLVDGLKKFNNCMKVIIMMSISYLTFYEMGTDSDAVMLIVNLILLALSVKTIIDMFVMVITILILIK